MYACVIFFILVRVVSAQLCSECQCCANGSYTNCENGYCNNGCIDGYYGDNCINKCSDQNCLICDRINGNYCSKCITGYYLNNKYCHECGPHCSSCEPTGCQSCQNGYYGNNCQWSCAAHCTTCKHWNDYCQSCKPGYYLQNNYCRECGTQCSSCDIKGCQSCNNGYFGSTCQLRCAAHCTSCQKSNGYCNSCESRYYLKNNHCYNCGTHCSLCETNGCQSCMDGYFGNTCEWICAAHCVSCRKSDGYCNSCKSGYYLKNNYCFKCESHCASCESTVCKACFDGYWGSTCNYRCGHHCSSCNQTNGVCVSCEDGYWGSPCTTCGSQCRVCNQSNGCLKCNAGYKCGKYNCNDCKECRKGYFKHDSYCHECKYKRDGCTCTSYGECSGCIEGYFLNPVFCAECLDPCTSCINHSMCTSCIPGRFGQTCQHGCSQYCKNGICEEKNARCRCYPNYKGEMCDQCEDGRYGDNCDELCSPWCGFGTCIKDTGFCPCKPGRYGNKCQSTCPTGCLNDICNRSDGSCQSCKKGYVGDRCNITCPSLCNSCDQFGVCTVCKPGYSNKQNQCTCKRDICVNLLDCKLCTNTSFFANGGDCCLCNLDNCVSCLKALDTVYCEICKDGYYPNSSGECKLCKSHCVNNECDTSSGKCYQGCTNGYWNKTCDKSCDQECVSCNQADGLCTQCKNISRFGPYCRRECSATCKNSKCDNNGNCMNGCIQNTFGKKCENKCDGSCSPKDNRTICSEKTGMCLYGCQTGYKERFCPKDVGNRSEKQTTLTAALGGGLGGGIIALIILAIIAMFWFRKRRRSNTGRNNSLHDARRDYDTVDANLREVELNDIRYEALQGTDVHTMDQTTDYSNVAVKGNDNITYHNVHGRSLSD